MDTSPRWEFPDEIISRIVSFLQNNGNALSALELVNRQFYKIVSIFTCEHVEVLKLRTFDYQWDDAEGKLQHHKLCEVQTRVPSDPPGYETVFSFDKLFSEGALKQFARVWRHSDKLNQIELDVEVADESEYFPQVLDVMHGSRPIETLGLHFGNVDSWMLCRSPQFDCTQCHIHLMELCKKLSGLRHVKFAMINSSFVTSITIRNLLFSLSDFESLDTVEVSISDFEYDSSAKVAVDLPHCCVTFEIIAHQAAAVAHESALQRLGAVATDLFDSTEGQLFSGKLKTIECKDLRCTALCTEKLTRTCLRGFEGQSIRLIELVNCKPKVIVGCIKHARYTHLRGAITQPGNWDVDGGFIVECRELDGQCGKSLVEKIREFIDSLKDEGLLRDFPNFIPIDMDAVVRNGDLEEENFVRDVFVAIFQYDAIHVNVRFISQ